VKANHKSGVNIVRDLSAAAIRHALHESALGENDGVPIAFQELSQVLGYSPSDTHFGKTFTTGTESHFGRMTGVNYDDGAAKWCGL
jgi:hypothetical protein